MLHEELKAGGGSPQLAALVASTAGKALALLAEKAEYMAATGPDVRALPGPGGAATAAQARNIALCSSLQVGEAYDFMAGLDSRVFELAMSGSKVGRWERVFTRLSLAGLDLLLSDV